MNVIKKKINIFPVLGELPMQCALNNKFIPLVNRNATLLAVAAFVLNLIFLYNNNEHYFYTISQTHGQLGYNFYHHNSCRLSPALSDHCAELMAEKNRLINFDEIDQRDFGVPSLPFPINDTIGYGIVLGLLWKLTGSLNFRDVQWLQIFLFVCSMFLFYQIAYLLFFSQKIALWCGIAHLLFFPLYAMNVQATRDIWAYYGMVFLAYGVLDYLFDRRQIWHLVTCGLLFALCQWVRPSVVLGLITISIVLIGYAVVHCNILKPVVAIISVLLFTNLIFFWIPFMTFNYQTYGRCFVGPVGQDLLEGLGEFSNQWHFELSDAWIDDYIYKKYGLHCGSPEFDDLAKKEFWQAYWQNPAFYFHSFFKRIPSLILPALPWIYYAYSPYQGLVTIQEKILFITSSWHHFLDFLLRHLYMRLFLLIGYCGVLFALFRKHYFVVAFVVIGIVCAGFGKLPSHIELRYIVPFYWGFIFFVGYLISIILKKS